MPKHKISVAIICKNEERNLREALLSVKWADEIVVVDSGSTDSTSEIANELATRVVHHDWPGHIEQKNYAADLCEGPWILSIDADERVTPELRTSIEGILESPRPEYDAWRVARLCFYLGRWIRHSGWYPDAKVRLWKKGVGQWGGYNPHDDVKVECPAGRLDGDLKHYVYRDVQHNLETIASYSSILAEQLHKRGRRAHVLDMLFRPPWVFVKKLVFRLGILDGRAGLVIALCSAYSVFAKYAKLWELQKENRL
jgi:glycosyltransferase involved in cell wall biosynthesis